MTETEIPQLHLSRDHLMAMTQLLNMLSQSLAEKRERRGRAAYSNAEHAARIADTHEQPVVRPMTETERQQFTGQAGDPQVPQHGLNVAAAPVGHEWGVRAVAASGDYASVMCPNITDAARLADYLRAQNNPAVVNELNELSKQIGHRVKEGSAPAADAADSQSAAQTAEPVEASDRVGRGTSEHPPLVDLVKNVPGSLTASPEWQRIETQFTDLTDRGVDPAALASGVQGLDFDRARRPEALVRWSLEDTARAWEREHPTAGSGPSDSAAVAEEWAGQLDPTSALDRAAASDAVGRYGPDVDAALAGTYPGLLTAATDARTMAEWDEGGALTQQQREAAEALTAESAARTLRGDDLPWGQGGEEDVDREEAAVTQDGDAAEHRGRQSDAGSEVERVRDEKVIAQFIPARTATAPRRTTGRTSAPVPVRTQTRTRLRGR